MTSTIKLMFAAGVILTFLCAGAYAQSHGPELNHFAADGLNFDYPAAYSLKDESTTEAQQLLMTKRGSSVQLTIIAMRKFINHGELAGAIKNFSEPAVKKVSLTLGPAATQVTFQTPVGARQADGVRLNSTGTKKTGEVIWLRLGFRLIGISFVRSESDKSAAAQLWQVVSSSLKVDAPVVGAKAPDTPATESDVTNSILNGRAIALPRPAYPAMAKAAHVSGTVTVQVIIDEEGNVISAHAIDGHPLLQAACVAAAKAARFSPTQLEGEPVKVTGVIKYNFVPQ